MSKIKVLNDPIYGLVSFPFEILYQLIDHRYFQRLRRISQVGLSCLVYPGAVHTRFHHALGVAHLASELIINLRLKGIDVSDKEYEATCIAALLHDIGHGPFSHALEKEILPVHHEVLTLKLMDLLNLEFGGQLSLAIEIFNGSYHKKFLTQILSSQLDVDRMDYLNRDSYYTGVAEGIIGYDRIIKMMTVSQDTLMIEKKGIYSVEKFFMSRYLMFRQVYLHKASISAEQMLKLFFRELKEDLRSKPNNIGSSPLEKLILLPNSELDDIVVEKFIELDDYDIIQALKSSIDSPNFILNYLSNGILNRKLFKTMLKKEKFSSDFITAIRHKTVNMLNVNSEMSDKLVILGVEKNTYYDSKNEIFVDCKETSPIAFSALSQFHNLEHHEIIYFATFPK